MKNRYEALLVLNTQGTDDNAREIIERLEKEFKEEGAEVEQVQRMDRRQFSYVAGPLDSGYYVNLIFNGDAAVLDKLKNRFRFDEQVYRQHYQKLKSAASS